MYYIGIDVGGTNLVAGLVDADGRIRDKASRPVPRDMTARQFGGYLVELAEQVCDKTGTARDQVEAVGIGLPGAVDNTAGLFVHNPNMPFSDKNVPLREMFQGSWNVPVYLGNDANCAAIGEYWSGAAKGCDPAVVITLGTGIGGGMVSGGRLFTGFANSGMEVGHMPIEPNGRPCGCGQKGCWETYGSASALIRQTREAMQAHPNSALWRLCEQDLDKVSGRTPFQGALEGDGTAQAVLEEYRGWLAQGLICLINVLQPEVICLGGGVSNAEEELLLLPLRELIRDRCFDPEHPPKLVRAALGNDAGVVGAAMLCKTL